MTYFQGSIRTAGLIGISLAALAASQPAMAADPAADPADTAVAQPESEIVVSASRRDTNIQDTPIAVAVTTGKSLEDNGVVSLQDLTRIAPSVVVNNQGVAGNQFIIRGVLSDIGSTTGLYLDEMPLLGGAAVEGAGDGRPGIRLHDVSRIEVLKGPQGTLFGSGSMAGTLRVITNKPELDTVAGGATASVGFIKGGNPIWQGDAYLNLPIASTVAVRAVAWGETGGGYIDHEITPLDGSAPLVLEDVNDRKVWGGRVQLLIEPSPDFSILLAGIHQEIDVDDSESWDLETGPYVSTSPTVEGYHDNYDALSATFEYTAPYGTFSLIGTYANQKTANPEDSTPTGLGLAGSFNIVPFKTTYQTSQEFEAYTGELRFASAFEGPIQFVAGAYYQHDKTDGLSVAVRADDVTGMAPCFTPAECEATGNREPGPPRPLLFPPDYFFPGNAFNPASDLIYAVGTARTVEQWAVYGQVDFEITDSLTATAGIRYFDANIHDVSTQIQDIAGPPDFAVFPGPPVPSWAANGMITVPYVTQDDRASENSPSYNFSLLYEATPDLSFFARVASGFRIGGTNNAASLASQAGVDIPASYGSDDLWSYEVGMKAYLADRHVFVDASIYQMDWSKQQLAAQDPSGAFDYVLNAGKSRIRGVELALTYFSDVGLSLGGGLTYVDAKLTEDLDADVIQAGTIGYDGDRLPRVPKWTAAAQARYETDLSETMGLYFQGDASFRGSSYHSFNDLNTFNERLDDFFIVGGRVGVTVGNFDFSVFGRNLTNKVAVYGLDASPDGIRVYSADPRTFGLQVSADF
jgi:outer membrane receptor protein involved in Fe transport